MNWVLRQQLRATLCVLVACTSARPAPVPPALSDVQASWDARAAANYMDGRQGWWLTWPTSSRDHETSCVSCHTAVPYALARPALRAALHEPMASDPERTLFEYVVKRVRLWREVEPFYPDQKNGLPKTSESRGTEAILNALILATRDARNGHQSEDGRLAFENMWALQFRTDELSGAWAWLNFHLQPWESDDAAYFGATLAAIAIGTAPDGYAARTEIQDRVKALREFLRRGSAMQPSFNRVTLLWASGRFAGLLSDSERQTIIDELWRKQQADGGWSLPKLGEWKRSDGSVQDTTSDGYATGLIAYALEQSGTSPNELHVAKALDWLVQHQDRETGRWITSSLNKRRDPASVVGKFMSDAATSFAVLALTQGRSPAH